MWNRLRLEMLVHLLMNKYVGCALQSLTYSWIHSTWVWRWFDKKTPWKSCPNYTTPSWYQLIIRLCFKVPMSVKQRHCTRHCSRMFGIPALDVWSSDVDPETGCPVVFVVLFSPSRQNKGLFLKLDDDRFHYILSNFQFSTHYHPSFDAL
jgi:hypothetical protein